MEEKIPPPVFVLTKDTRRSLCVFLQFLKHCHHLMFQIVGWTLKIRQREPEWIQEADFKWYFWVFCHSRNNWKQKRCFSLNTEQSVIPTLKRCFLNKIEKWHCFCLHTMSTKKMSKIHIFWKAEYITGHIVFRPTIFLSQNFFSQKFDLQKFVVFLKISLAIRAKTAGHLCWTMLTKVLLGAWVTDWSFIELKVVISEMKILTCSLFRLFHGEQSKQLQKTSPVDCFKLTWLI